MGLGLLAAVCWASYILLNRAVGRRIPGAQGSAAAAGPSALAFLLVGVVVVVRNPPTAWAVGYAAAAGILASPVLAALAALADWIMLEQGLGRVEWAAIGSVVVANALSILVPRSCPTR